MSRRKSLRCPVPPCDGLSCEGDCHILRSCIYLLRSPPNDNLQDSFGGFWLFKITETKDGAFVLQNPFCCTWDCSDCAPFYRGLLLDSLNCQIVALGCDHMAYAPQLFDPADVKMCDPVAFVQLGAGNDDFAVLSFSSLAMFSSVDKQWKGLEGIHCFEAIASFNGKFYVVDCTGTTTVIKPSREASYFRNSRPHARRRELVQSRDELLLVECFSNNVGWFDSCLEVDVEEKNMRLEVSKLDEDKNEWAKVQDLGDRVLFFAEGCSFSCLASEIPGITGSSIFFIYFGNSRHNSFDRVLVFNLKDQSLRFMKDIPRYLELFWPPPSWMIH